MSQEVGMRGYVARGSCMAQHLYQRAGVCSSERLVNQPRRFLNPEETLKCHNSKQKTLKTVKTTSHASATTDNPITKPVLNICPLPS